MRVLHLITSLNRGGIERWLLSMAREIPRSACEIDFCCKGATVGDLAGNATTVGAQVLLCPLRPDHVRFVRNLRRILAGGRYDIVHNHLEVYSGIAVWASHSLGLPVVTSFHNTHQPPQLGWAHLPVLRQMRATYGLASMSYAVHKSDAVTGCSRGVVDSLARFGAEKRARGAQVLYYGTEMPRPSTPAGKMAFRESLGWEPDAPILLHVGRFIEQKNHLGLLTIFQGVLQHLPSARLVLVGDGLMRPAIEKAVADRGLSDRVRLLGWRDDVPALMTMSDVFVFPSLYEGLPVVGIEAQAAGLPIVASKVPGLLEAIRPNETGLLVNVEDLEGFTNAVVHVLRDHRLSAVLAENGKRHVQQQFSTAASAGRLIGLYEAILAEQGVRSAHAVGAHAGSKGG